MFLPAAIQPRHKQRSTNFPKAGTVLIVETMVEEG